jgi:hypothetical protein
MARKNTIPAITAHEELIEEANELLASVAQPEAAETPTAQELADDAEIDEQIALPNSVVKPAYKIRYKLRARENGHKSKAAKRSAWDWLAVQLAGELLDKHGKISVDKAAAIFVANGIEEADILDENGHFIADKSRWPSQSKGWEGRYRMTGGLALRPVVAEQGYLQLPDGEQLEAPAEWVAKYLR